MKEIELNRLFNLLDIGGDGKLSREDLRMAAEILGWSWREAPLYTTATSSPEKIGSAHTNAGGETGGVIFELLERSIEEGNQYFPLDITSYRCYV